MNKDYTNGDIYQEKDKQYHLRVYDRYPVTLHKGRGHLVWDTNNKKYIDAFAGISVVNIGHCHPKVVTAIQEQAENLMHVSNFFYTRQQAMLAEQLCEKSGMDKVFMCNSGAEAVEGAIKLARKYYWEQNQKNGTILTMSNCFHGRTLATTAAGRKKFHEGFGPMPAGFEQVPFNDEQALEEAFNKHDVVGVMIELVQGEGGIYVANQSYVNKIRELCDKHGALMITDQVQCGLGRAGKWFTHEHYGVMPDLITNAKALGGGMPMGVFQTKEEVAKALDFGQHGTTFGGNPLACAAALASLKVLREENLPERSLEKGKELKDKIIKGTKELKGVKEVRGLGMMIGVELNYDGNEVLRQLREKGVLVNLMANKIIRLLPTLNIPDHELEKLGDILIDTLKENDHHAEN